MRKLLQISVVAGLLATGCSGVNGVRQSSSLPVRYHDSKYDLAFSLPASWRGYAVWVKPFDVSLSSTNYQNQIGIEHLQIITFRNPQWTTNEPYKDIAVTIYTRQQWDEEKQDRLATHAGGIIEELWHNQNYVFGLPSRYYAVENDDDGREFKGMKEAMEIITQNCALNDTPRLYPQ
jgi:hypothetical protein